MTNIFTYLSTNNLALGKKKRKEEQLKNSTTTTQTYHSPKGKQLMLVHLLKIGETNLLFTKNLLLSLEVGFEMNPINWDSKDLTIKPR